MTKTLLLLSLLCAALSCPPARADNESTSGLSPKQGASLEDNQDTAQTAKPAPKKKKKKKNKKPKKAKKSAAQKAAESNASTTTPPAATPAPVVTTPAPVVPAAPVATPKAETKAEAIKQEEAAEEVTNARMKTEEGSKSPVSGQLSLAYSGSSLNHPFSEFAPNPSGASVPPLVTASGTASLRYRLDRSTTAGVGTGITTQTPFQGPKNTTVANPYVDLAHSWKMGKIQNRTDIELIFLTEEQAHQEYGQKFGLWSSNEAYYEFDFGLTVGLFLELDVNTYSNSPRFAGLDSGGTPIRAGQKDYVVYPEPYFEFTLSKKLSLRSVMQIEFDHLRTAGGFFDLYSPKVTQTLGLGISATDWLFLYPYVLAVPYSGTFGVKTTTLGLQAIINLF